MDSHSAPIIHFLSRQQAYALFFKLQSLNSRRKEHVNKLVDYTINIKVHPALFDMFLIDDVVIRINKDNAWYNNRKTLF